MTNSPTDSCCLFSRCAKVEAEVVPFDHYRSYRFLLVVFAFIIFFLFLKPILKKRGKRFLEA